MNIEELPVAAVQIDRHRTILSASDAAARLAGRRREDMLGVAVDEVFRPRRPDGEDMLVEGWHPSAMLPTVRRFNEHEAVVRNAKGEEIDVMVDGGYQRAPDGTLTGATLLMRARHKGPRRPRSGVRIVSAVSHELRSPLTSMRGYTTLLLKRWDDVPDDDRRQMLQQIDTDARRIGRMIGELLDISRLETGKMLLNRRETDIGALARSVLEKVGRQWADLEAEVAISREFPEVPADPDKIEQVLTNLVENACKYASPKGIRIAARNEGDWAHFEVSDRGPGIPAADLPRLFRQFFRSSEGRPTGTGLGLWISRGLIEAHGGTMVAEAGDTEGVVFRFTLPRYWNAELAGPQQG